MVPLMSIRPQPQPMQPLFTFLPLMTAMGISQTPYHNCRIPLLYSTVTGFVPSSCLFATHTLQVQLDMRLRRPPSSRYRKPHRSLTLLVQYAELHRSPGPRVSSAGPNKSCGLGIFVQSSGKMRKMAWEQHYVPTTRVSDLGIGTNFKFVCNVARLGMVL